MQAQLSPSVINAAPGAQTKSDMLESDTSPPLLREDTHS
jgi:hypothetical protein